jgi:hypothetical protein
MVKRLGAKPPPQTFDRGMNGHKFEQFAQRRLALVVRAGNRGAIGQHKRQRKKVDVS